MFELIINCIYIWIYNWRAGQLGHVANAHSY